MIKTKLGWLRLFAYLEGISFILLLGAGMPLKYFYSIPQPNFIIGMLHGLLFMAYCCLLYLVKTEQKWSITKTLWAFYAALIPFGTFVADKKLFSK